MQLKLRLKPSQHRLSLTQKQKVRLWEVAVRMTIAQMNRQQLGHPNRARLCLSQNKLQNRLQ
jgi:hypothetical protein